MVELRLSLVLLCLSLNVIPIKAPFPKCSICGDIFPDTIFLEEHTKHLHQVHHASTRHRTAVKPPHPSRKYRSLIFAAHILICVLLCYYVAG